MGHIVKGAYDVMGGGAALNGREALLGATESREAAHRRLEQFVAREELVVALEGSDRVQFSGGSD